MGSTTDVMFFGLVVFSMAIVAFLGSRHSLRFWRFVQPSLFADETAPPVSAVTAPDDQIPAAA